MTIRISTDFSSFVVIDDEQRTHVVPLDPSKDISEASPDTPSVPSRPEPDGVRFPAFPAEPGSRLIDMG